MRRDGDRDVERLSPAGALDRGLEPLAVLGHRTQADQEAVPAVGVAGGAQEGALAAPADDHRQRALDRARVGVDALEVDVLAVERGRLVLPEAAHGGQVLVRACPAALHRDADRGHLGLEVGDPDAEDQPPAGEDVEAGDLLGQHQRVALRQDDHAGAEQDALGVRGDVRERHERVEHRLLGLHRRRIGTRARQHHVLAGPEGVVAEPLGQLGHLGRRLRLGAGVVVDREQADGGRQ
jgi:hypothetical protein